MGGVLRRLYFLAFLGLSDPFAGNPVDYRLRTAGHGTAEVIMVAPGVIVAATDSKEVSYTFLSDGTTDESSFNSCKVRRVGNTVVMAAGFVRANEFNALDAVRDLERPGDQLHDLASRVLNELPAQLAPALEAARRSGDARFRKSLADANALEIALIGIQNDEPAVVLIVLMAQADAAGHIMLRHEVRRCPGDCPAGRSTYFLGAHEAIDRAIQANSALIRTASAAAAAELLDLEYAARPDIVGGPRTVLRANSSGVRIVEAGACSARGFGEEAIVSIREPDSPLDVLSRQDFVAELDRRIAGVKNLVCHQTLHRLSRSGRSVRADIVEAELRIIGNQEMYSDIYRQGRRYESFTQLPGAWASGELLTILQVTQGAMRAQAGRLTTRLGADGSPETGVSFQHSSATQLWSLFVNRTPNAMSFEGTAWFGKAERQLRGIKWTSTGVVRPERLQISQISWEVTFAPVRVAGESFLAPSAAVYEVKYRPETRREDRTQSEFSDFRRFATTAQLLD
ncbi:MAG: hypothetical protein JWN34_1187 [Bryobacterales bacterium]|nr:hypothetical protein [Bryobacterales bacterium]